MINIARFISVSALESVVFHHTISVIGISVNFHIGATLNKIRVMQKVVHLNYNARIWVKLCEHNMMIFNYDF